MPEKIFFLIFGLKLKNRESGFVRWKTFVRWFLWMKYNHDVNLKFQFIWACIGHLLLILWVSCSSLVLSVYFTPIPTYSRANFDHLLEPVSTPLKQEAWTLLWKINLKSAVKQTRFYFESKSYCWWARISSPTKFTTEMRKLVGMTVLHRLHSFNKRIASCSLSVILIHQP